MAGNHKTKLGPDKQNEEGSKMTKKSTVNHVPGFKKWWQNKTPYTSGRTSSGGTNKSIVMSSTFSLLFRYFVFCNLSCIASSPNCQRTMTPVMILRPGVPTTKRMIPRKRRKMSSAEVVAEYVDLFLLGNQRAQSLGEPIYHRKHRHRRNVTPYHFFNFSDFFLFYHNNTYIL